MWLCYLFVFALFETSVLKFVTLCNLEFYDGSGLGMMIIALSSGQRSAMMMAASFEAG